ncbi:MAG: class II aldolase/adducin family protein [Dehalococcoidia bacterium]
MSEVAEMKERLAQCCRMLLWVGLFDHSGHVSARIPGTDRVLIHPRHVSRHDVEARHILTVDLTGRLIEGDLEPPSETSIHTCIYRAREDVLSVAHLHSHYATLLSMTGRTILPVCNQGALFAGGVPVYPISSTVRDDEEGKALAQTLGGARAVLLKGHGSVVVAESIEGVFVAGHSLESTARFQYELMLLGEPKPLSESEIGRSVGLMWNARGINKVWSHCESLARKAGVL